MEVRNEYNTILPDLVPGTECTSKKSTLVDYSKNNLPQISNPTGTHTSVTHARTINQNRYTRNIDETIDKVNYIGSFVEMPMQYNNAFHNSFYNT